MSSTSANTSIFLCLRWFCLLVIICFDTSSSQGVGKLCGKALPEALDFICTNGFGRKTKKSIEPVDYYEDMDVDISSSFDQSPFFLKFPTNALTKTRRRRHGVYDECCRKPCSLAELRTYCL